MTSSPPTLVTVQKVSGGWRRIRMKDEMMGNVMRKKRIIGVARINRKVAKGILCYRYSLGWHCRD